MAKFIQFVLVAVAIGVCIAEPIRFRGNRNNRFFARQEEAPSSTTAPAPYPPAGVTPAIAFELPTEEATVQPDNTYLPPAPEPTPDNTYGPPEATPDTTYGPPDNQYGPPAAVDAEAEAAAADDLPVVDPRIERLILAQRNQKASPAQLRQQRRRSQALKASRLQLNPSVEIIRSHPVIAYSVQYKSF